MSDVSTPLLAAVLVFRSKAAFLDLPYAVSSVSAFLDSSVELSLQQACKFHSLALLDRIWNSSDVYGIRNNVTDGTWTLWRFLRTDKYYRQLLFTLFMQEAVVGQDLELVKWLSSRFQGATVTFDTVAKACEAGSMEILDFFKENDRFSLEETDEADVGLDIEWGGLAMSAAILGGRSDLVQWLPEPGSRFYYDLDTALQSAVKMGAIPTAEWLGARGARWPEITDDSVLSLAAEGRLDVLQWLETRGIVSQRIDGVVLLVVAAAGNGRLEVIRWLMDSVLKRRSSIKQTYIAAAVATFSIHAAAAHGHLNVARFLHGLTCALVNGQVTEIMSRSQINSFQGLFSQQLDPPRYEVCKISGKTMVKAVENGFLGVVRWLVGVYSGDPTNKFQYKMRQGLVRVLSMDVAAINGQLQVLRYLHTLQISGISGLECTICAMDGAAANGHLEVVKWLHLNRHEGCSSGVMGKAAAGGHLDVVKWLHENRREGYVGVSSGHAAQIRVQAFKFLAASSTWRHQVASRSRTFPKHSAVIWSRDCGTTSACYRPKRYFQVLLHPGGTVFPFLLYQTHPYTRHAGPLIQALSVSVELLVRAIVDQQNSHKHVELQLRD